MGLVVGVEGRHGSGWGSDVRRLGIWHGQWGRGYLAGSLGQQRRRRPLLDDASTYGSDE